jgi:prepilin-type N-terminal cleavage/methylation domain-containing protein
MIRHIRETVARRRGVELEPGFTLIELLIVIVVLGILAATVIFALTGITGQSAQAACQSDAKTYEIAAAAYQDAPANSGNTPASTTAELTGTNFGGPFLHQAANSTSYVVFLSGDSNAPAGDSAAGTIYVGPTAAAAVAYDSEVPASAGPPPVAATGCYAVS